MFINIESTSASLLDSVYHKLRVLKPTDLIITNPTDALSHEYTPGSGVHVVTNIDIDSVGFNDTAAQRWAHLRLASFGARFWCDSVTPKQASPIYAPELLHVLDEADKIIVDATYAEGRAAHYKSLGVNYIGRTYTDPRTIVLVDYRGDKTHDPASDNFVHDILETLPGGDMQSSWASFGVVSTGNVEKLRDFLGYTSSTNILAYSDGAVAKLGYLGRDFGHVGVPSPDKSYGISLREASSRMREF